MKKQPRTMLDKIAKPPLAFLLIGAAIFVVYVQIIPLGFTWFDDDLIVIKNLDWYGNAANIGESFDKDAFNDDVGYAFYRPMQHISYFIDVTLWGPGPGGFRGTNMLIHALTCICLLTLLRLLKLDARLAFLGVLLYAVHPLFTSAVVWIPSRGDLLIGLFALLSYIALLKYLESGRALFLLLHAAAFFAAVFSKETAILLPLVFAAHILLFGGKLRFHRKYAWLAACWITIPAAYMLLRSLVILTWPKSDEFGIGPFLANLRTVPEFLAGFLFPVHLAVLPVFSAVSTVMGVLLVFLLGWLILSKFKAAGRICILGSGWFLLFTAVTMLYRHKLGSAAYDYLEHRTYLPAMGILMVLVAALGGIVERWGWRKLLAGTAAVAVAFSVTTVVRSRTYGDPWTFYAAALESNPGCALAYYNRAKYRQMTGDQAGAMADYDDAIRVKPDCADAYNNRGNARKSAGDLKGALQDYDAAVKYDSGFALAFFNRGNARLELGDKEGAGEDYSQAIALDPSYVKAMNNRGTIYYGAGKLDQAYADFDRAIQIDPGFGEAWRNRGSVKFQRRDVAGACADWSRGAQVGNKEAAGLHQQYCR